MPAYFHYTIDAYGCLSQQTNKLMVINDFLVTTATELDMQPVMPPFLVPYYYCDDAQDVGISAFCICADGSHITIHTFPERSCYFIDILTNSFLEEAKVKDLVCKQLYAGNFSIQTLDRRDFASDPSAVDTQNDFGPHFMITVNNPKTSFEAIYKWLETIAPKINMNPISRPYVIYDRVEDPQTISGILVVAQSHIAFHYCIEDDVANIDIFSCSFLDLDVIEAIIHEDFGMDARIDLFARGSKHRYECQHYSRQTRIEKNKTWQKNL